MQCDERGLPVIVCYYLNEVSIFISVRYGIGSSPKLYPQ